MAQRNLPQRPLLAYLGMAWLGLVAWTQPVQAASFTTSAVSDSVSQSVGSISGSISQSSDASSRPARVAAGDYRILEVAQLPVEAGQQTARVAVRLQTLAAAAGQPADEVTLKLPQSTWQNAGLQVGGVLRVLERDYGVALADAQGGQPFFLIMDDARYRELAPVVVKL